MGTNCVGFRVGLSAVSLALMALCPAPALALSLLAQTTFGGPGDEIGTGVAVNASGVYFSGSGNGGAQGVVGQFSSSLGPSPVWSRSWSSPTDSSSFNGVALSSTGAIAAGYSYTQTVDLVGGKEIKGITVKFNADGSPGGGVSGAVWSRQTPATPGAYPYGGIEWLTGVVTVSEGGQMKIYATGLGQDSRFFNRGLGTISRFVTKLDDAGTVLWTRTDDSTIVAAPSSPLWSTRTTGIAADGSSLYVASRSESSGVHPDLKKYDPNGNLLWSRTSAASGEYRGVTSAGGKVYAVGQTNPESTNPDFLIESWDGTGNLLWSKTYARSLAQDTLNAVVFEGGHLFAVGSTMGGTAGDNDGILLEIDALTGNLLDSTLWGGAADDSFNNVAITGSRLYAVGSTRSFGTGGSDGAIASFALPTPGVPEPGTLALVLACLPWVAGNLRAHGFLSTLIRCIYTLVHNKLNFFKGLKFQGQEGFKLGLVFIISHF